MRLAMFTGMAKPRPADAPDGDRICELIPIILPCESSSGPPVTDPNAPFPGANGQGSGATASIGPDGTVYVGANNSNFYAVGPDGQMKWMYEAEREVAGIWSAAAISADGQALYFGANKGGVYAVDAETGTKHWQFAVYGSIYASSILDSRGVLYTGTTIETRVGTSALDGAHQARQGRGRREACDARGSDGWDPPAASG